jgi:hypothetical protein
MKTQASVQAKPSKDNFAMELVRDPEAPKRAKSAYLFYSGMKHKEIRSDPNNKKVSVWKYDSWNMSEIFGYSDDCDEVIASCCFHSANILILLPAALHFGCCQDGI